MDDLFAIARGSEPDMSDDLRSRMLADAARVQTGWRSRVQRRSWRASLGEILGGWPAMGGLVAAGLTGIWLGVSPPALLPDPLDLVSDRGLTFDIFAGDDLVAILAEEG